MGVIIVKIIMFLVGTGCAFFTGYFLAATKFRKDTLDRVGFYNWLSVLIIYIAASIILGILL